jgi:tetratricopeptide (TPR) repeat protein
MVGTQYRAAGVKLSVTAACLCIYLFPAFLFAHPGAHEAAEHFSRQIEVQPKDQRLYIQRGIVYSNDGQYEQALDDFQAAVALGDPLVVSFDLGVLYYRKGEFDKALLYFDQTLKRFPNHVQCLEYRARLSRDAGDNAAALADFRRLFQLQPRSNPGHYISAAKMLEATGPAGLDQALEILDLGNQQLGLTPQLQTCAIQLELQAGRPQAAIERLRALEPMLGSMPDWKIDMGELLLQVGHREEADQLFNAASMQLDSLRDTPARLASRERLKRLRTAPSVSSTYSGFEQG